MSAPPSLPPELRGELARCARAAVERGELAALCVELEAHPAAALAAFEAFASAAGERFYFEQPSEARAIAAIGAVESIEAKGSDRLERASALARELFARVHVASLSPSRALAPLIVGGFAFESATSGSREWSAYAPLSFAMPELAYARDGDIAFGCAVARALPGETADALALRLERALAQLARAIADAERALAREPASATAYTARPDRPHREFLAQIESARARIASGALEKVVLARSLEVETDVPYDLVSLLASLRRVHATTTIFAVERGESAFVGATPECLLRVAGERVQTVALAGTAPRGRSADEDAQLGRALRESKKEQEEHAYVASDVEAALAPFVVAIERAEAPALLALDGIQHLCTPIAGRLRRGSDGAPAHLFEIAARLHPTPAVGGAPRAAACEWIRAHERLDRGWYAGGVGYATADGGGDLRVALRSGLVHGARARLFAGVGIVAASDATQELAETRLKLRTMLSQLTEI